VKHILVILMVYNWALFAEESPPLAVQKVITSMSSTILMTKQQAVKDIRKIAVDLGKQGDLDTALTVKVYADQLDDEIRALQPGGTPLAGKLSGVAKYNGRWLVRGQENQAFNFKDGTYICPNATGGGPWKSGTVVQVDADTLAFYSGVTKVETFRIVTDDVLMSGNADSWIRAKEPKTLKP